ncbi:MAG: hypothetical protein CFE24_14145 [Flavobacterium sp. BFFFF2]|nr:MAG: hypothetical protein CFE24_14145 [Flavobacterium sp. BFFFF2]
MKQKSFLNSLLSNWRLNTIALFLMLFSVSEMNAQCEGTMIHFTWGGGLTYHYNYVGQRNGKCAYVQQNPGTSIEWTGTKWVIYGNSQFLGDSFFESSVNLGDRPSGTTTDWISNFNLAIISFTGDGVIIAPSLAAPTAAAQSFCNSATVADLVASGDSGATFSWYDVATDGTALASTTALANGTYYVSQTVGAIESGRTAVTVTINSTSAATATSSQSFCDAGTVANLAASGTAIKWYAASTGGDALTSSTSLANGSNYYATQTLDGCESATRTAVSVSINATPTFAGGTFFVNAGEQIQNVFGFFSAYSVYTSNVAPTPLAPTSILNSGTYFATLTLNGCQSPRAQVIITSYALPIISSPTCGSRLSSLSAPITCRTVPNATNYLFEVSANGSTRNYYSATNSFNLTQLQGSSAYNTGYSIRVAAGFNGQYGNFGSACTITTPETPVKTKVVPTQCGTTLTSKWTAVYCSPVIGATAYRFEWSNGGNTLTYTSSTPGMQLGNFTGWAYGTTYSVRVAVQNGGNWLAYGTACNITTNSILLRHSAGQESGLSIKAVPNPIETEFVLTSTSNNQNDVLVTVFDMLGKQVEQFKAKANELENRPLGLSYTSGVYNVVVLQGDEQQTVRIVKK